MSSKVVYEWDIETWSEDGEDCIEHYHSDVLSGDHAALAKAGGVRVVDGKLEKLVLVRAEVDSAGCVDLRDWAYVAEGKLSEDTEDYSYRVPQRFHKELAKSITA